MLKKILLLSLCLCLALSVGCSKKGENLSNVESEPVVEETPVVENTLHVNPLTGLKDITQEKINDRPLAITINNIKIAQPVQTGIGKADIVYETEVEGGITRLLALYQNPEKVAKIGTVRSARYVFIDLAMGHNAIYIHHGMDYFHALSHLDDVDRLVLGTNNGGVRNSNGLASEHTLYAYGDKVWNYIKNSTKIKTETNKAVAWQTFADENQSLTLSNTASSVTVPFSTSSKSTFTYDSSTGRYKRSFNGTQRNDYVTKETVSFKNVFVLLTTIRNYNCTGDDNKGHREVLLESGTGYYFVNGTYTPINWSKGKASNGIKLTNTDGTPLTVNAGNSWVCIADKSKSSPQIS